MERRNRRSKSGVETSESERDSTRSSEAERRAAELYEKGPMRESSKTVS